MLCGFISCGIKVKATLNHRKLAFSLSARFFPPLPFMWTLFRTPVKYLGNVDSREMWDLVRELVRLSSSMCFCLCVNEGGETRGELQPAGYLHRLDEVSLMYGFNLELPR